MSEKVVEAQVELYDVLSDTEVIQWITSNEPLDRAIREHAATLVRDGAAKSENIDAAISDFTIEVMDGIVSVDVMAKLLLNLAVVDPSDAELAEIEMSRDAWLLDQIQMMLSEFGDFEVSDVRDA